MSLQIYEQKLRFFQFYEKYFPLLLKKMLKKCIDDKKFHQLTCLGLHVIHQVGMLEVPEHHVADSQ